MCILYSSIVIERENKLSCCFGGVNGAVNDDVFNIQYVARKSKPSVIASRALVTMPRAFAMKAPKSEAEMPVWARRRPCVACTAASNPVEAMPWCPEAAIPWCVG